MVKLLTVNPRIPTKVGIETIQRIISMKALFIFILGIGLACGTTPTRIPSFGPNGTHWPGQVSGLVTPYMYDDTVPNIIEVPCNWTAIANAINGLTSEKVTAGVLILVQPGTLAGSTATSVLHTVGNKTWTKRVTVAPRDGWGSVVISGGIKWTKVRNVCLAGFDIQGGVRIVSSTRFAIARCTVTGYIAISGIVTDETEYRQWEFVEMVKRVVNAPYDADVMQLQVPQSGATDNIYGTVMDGCYFAPNYMNIGASAHQDTIQHLSGGGYRFHDGTIQDTVVFASNRCAINGGLVNTTLRNCWLNSRKSNQTQLYPVPAGAAMTDNAGVNQGSVGNLTFDGGYVMGPLQSNTGVSATPYGTVLNGATIDYTVSGSALPTSGTWTVDRTLDGRTKPGYPQLPTDDYLAGIWKKGSSQPSVQVVSSPLISPQGGVFDAPQSVVLSSSTAQATIYFTIDGSEPSRSSPIYNGSITISGDVTIKALAVKDGYKDSLITSATFKIGTVTPLIIPNGGNYIEGQQVSMETSTQGASIFYTLDGSMPTSSSNLYSGKFIISKSSTIRAIAAKSGLRNSQEQTAVFVIGGPYQISEEWSNLTIPVQKGEFRMTWDCTPGKVGLDAVVGIGVESVDTYTDLACMVRFAPNGFVDARDGSGYRSLNPMPYEPNRKYRVAITVNITTKRYDVTVTPEGGVSVVIASQFSFRTEQIGITQLASLAFMAPGTGGLLLENIDLVNSEIPSTPSGLRVLTPNNE